MPNHNRHPNLDSDHHHVNSSNPPSPPKPSPKLLSIFLKFIVMSIILSLFLLFLGLAAILLLHLLLAGSFLHRRRQRLLLRSTPRLTSSFSLRDIQNHLPPFQYSSAAASDDCSICLEYFNEGEICRVLPVCDHVFHARCVDTWLTKVPNCPICRTGVRLDACGSSDSVISDEETKFLWAIGVGREPRCPILNYYHASSCACFIKKNERKERVCVSLNLRKIENWKQSCFERSYLFLTLKETEA